METLHIIKSLAAVILFALIFFLGPKLRMHRPGQLYYRRFLSFAGGVSVAYVFIHLLPELHITGAEYIHFTTHLSLTIQEYWVYIAALIGFMFSYGLQNMVTWSRLTMKKESLEEKEEKKEKMIYAIHVGGFVIYVWLISYLLVYDTEKDTISLILYTVAMGLHFLVINYSLYQEHGSLYEQKGKNVLALASLAGWLIAICIEFPANIIVTIIGIVSGAVIMNSLINELPDGKEGKFPAFLLGGILYAVLLLLI
ncbi:MAG: hypothetical protein ACNYWM_08020 [Methanosarcinales archaeon]